VIKGTTNCGGNHKSAQRLCAKLVLQRVRVLTYARDSCHIQLFSRKA
jgi:Flp pilus assembly protein CpaB